MSATPLPSHLTELKMVDLHNAALSPSLSKSRYGTAQPQLDVRLPPGASHRQLSALLHAFAARLELNTPANERWLVQTERLSEPNHGRLYLELAEGDEAEARRGMKLLNTLLG
ncbi:hypothetical protein KRR26_36020 [Corallococcus sp. M34]|uniref:hypothetical protein n=1 Tax=Citreicoccus inhibens TaxID=2849499 RepID=UPI001C21ED81|nr:hypothetical protein [Citreicoccus inhibens]MBU8901016.1 hypothetical protein [Citreicoccus inhibens]